MLSWAMSHPSFKTQLFRFVDVFPATTDDADVLRHLREYFDQGDAPRIVDVSVGVAEHVPGGERLSASIARRNITKMAQQFVVGRDPGEALDNLHALWRAGSAFTVDLLGEKTVTEAEADRYTARVDELLRVLTDGTARWAPDDHLERDDVGILPRTNISIKPTALASLYSPLTADEGIAQAKARLRPLLADAVARHALRVVRHGAPRSEGPHHSLVSRVARRTRAGGARRRHCDPGLPEGEPRRRRRVDPVGIRTEPAPRNQPPVDSTGQGCVLGLGDDHGPG